MRASFAHPILFSGLLTLICCCGCRREAPPSGEPTPKTDAMNVPGPVKGQEAPTPKQPVSEEQPQKKAANPPLPDPADPPVSFDKLPPADPLAMLKRLKAEYETDADAADRPIISITFSMPGVTDLDLAHLRDLKQLRVLRLISAEKVTDGGLAYLRGLAGLQELDLTGTKLTGAGFPHVAMLKTLRVLRLPYQEYTVEQLEPLANLTDLEVFGVSLDRQVDAKLKTISKMTKLRYINIQNTDVSDEGVALLAGMAGLEEVTLISRSRLTDRSLSYLGGLKRLRSLWFSGEFGDTGLVHLAGLTNLEFLSLENGSYTDKSLVHLAGLTKLQSLNLTNARITDAGLTHFKNLTGLQILNLNGCKGITGVGLVHLKNAKQLSKLQLDDTGFNDAGAAAVKEFPNVISLDLDNAPLTNAGLVHLKELKHLRMLMLDGTKITDEGLVHLTALKELRWLRLDNNPNITDAAIPHLKKLPPLQSLQLDQTKITEKGLKELQDHFNKSGK